MSSVMRFALSDFDVLPAPGFYACTVAFAYFCDSAQGNRMLQVDFTFLEVGLEMEKVSDYFVLEGASARGLITARRRLVQLYRACGRNPREGDVIDPKDLLLAQLEVKIEHNTWENKQRLRVVSYRAH
jgi:hypothetical protein